MPESDRPMPVALSIAGTDPSGGAGTSADLKTFSALGAYGTSVVTAVVVQNTQGVADVFGLSGDQVRAQLENLLADIPVDAIKIGMLGTTDVIHAVAEVLAQRPARYVVLDPVMVAKSGHRLLSADAVEALRERLIPHVDLITPNLPEAADLLGVAEASGRSEMREQLAALTMLTTLTGGVLLKGGHLDGAESVDLLSIDGQVHELAAPRVDTRNTHGTGCTLSAAIAALRPERVSWYDAVRDAKDYLTEALLAADTLHLSAYPSRGHGPVHHFHATW